jgi:hypothetical protein
MLRLTVKKKKEKEKEKKKKKNGKRRSTRRSSREGKRSLFDISFAGKRFISLVFPRYVTSRCARRAPAECKGKANAPRVPIIQNPRADAGPRIDLVLSGSISRQALNFKRVRVSFSNSSWRPSDLAIAK